MQALTSLVPGILDIYIPTYLRPKSTLNCLKYLQKKGYIDHPRVNIIVSENSRLDSSNSYSRQLSLLFPSVVFTSNDCNRGFGFAVAKAFVITVSDYLWILGSDDIPLLDACELLELLVDHDLVTSFDSSILTNNIYEDTLSDRYAYLTNIVEFPFGFISATIVSKRILSLVLDQVTPKFLLSSGACPHAIIFLGCLYYSRAFYAIASSSSKAFVASRRISEEAYAHIQEESQSTGIKFSKGPGRWAKLWVLTIASISSSPLFESFDPLFLTQVYTTYRRNLFVPYLTLFSSSTPYNKRLPLFSLIVAFMRKPLVLFKVSSFILGVYDAPSIHTFIFLLSGNPFSLRHVYRSYQDKIDQQVVLSNVRSLNSFRAGGLWHSNVY